MRYLAPLLLIIGVLTGCSSGSAPRSTTKAATIPPQVASQAASAAPTAFTLSLAVSAAPTHHSSITGEAEPSACDDYHLEHAPVVVRDEHGTVLATSVTSTNARPEPTPLSDAENADLKRAGLINAAPQSRKDEAAYFEAAFSCRTTADVSVPRAQFYQITIGGHSVTPYGFDQLQQTGWKVELRLP